MIARCNSPVVIGQHTNVIITIPSVTCNNLSDSTAENTNIEAFRATGVDHGWTRGYVPLLFEWGRTTYVRPIIVDGMLCPGVDLSTFTTISTPMLLANEKDRPNSHSSFIFWKL